MSFPFFYSAIIDSNQRIQQLDENAAKHINQVLRMKKGDKIYLTNGKGVLTTATIEEQLKKGCTVAITDCVIYPASLCNTTIAISLVKNTARFEWFLEKATEMGISSVVPLICERSERIHVRRERMQSIMISAMLQSRQTWLPALGDPTPFIEWISSPAKGARFIAHCLPDEKKHFREMVNADTDMAIAIGPEGDFTDEEVNLALDNNCIPTSLGSTRLRTETAGLVAAALMTIW